MSALFRVLGTNLVRRHVRSRIITRGVASSNTDQILTTAVDTKSVTKTLPEIRFETVDDVGSVLVTGPILPWSEMNFLQYAILPYSLSSMYYLDKLLEYMPWGAAISATTVTFRLLFIPLLIKQNVVGIRIHNILPETQKIQIKLNQAMVNGNSYDVALQRTNLALLYREHKVGIWDRLWPTLVQVPMFLSMFLLLRKMSDYPVASLIDGGYLWFSNLSVADPYYVLPATAALTSYLVANYGLEGSTHMAQSLGPIGKWVFRLFPVAIFAFTMNFPAAVTLYWSTNNAITLTLAVVLRNKWLKQKLNIPQRLQHDPSSLPLSQQSFMGQLNTALDKGRVKKTTMDVRRLDDMAFRKAGVGPLRKTYKTNPKEQG